MPKKYIDMHRKILLTAIAVAAGCIRLPAAYADNSQTAMAATQTAPTPDPRSAPSTAATDQPLSLDTGTSQTVFDRKTIRQMPQGDNTPLNQVLLQAPGVVQDSFGQLHVRGDHANLQYRIDGIIIPESISGFGQTLDVRSIDSLKFLTGALPAQFGYRTAGVIDITTKSGAELGNGGSVGVYGGS